MGYTWLTTHRVLFAQERDLSVEGVPSRPKGAAAWRFGADAPLKAGGLGRTGMSRGWGGVGFYDTQAAAEAVISDPVAHAPWLAGAVEHWHALAVVIAHRGEVGWSKPGEPHPALVPHEDDPGGVLAVITSAGYTSRGPERHDQIRDFLRRVNEVRDYYRTLPANVAAGLYNATAGEDGMTFTIWKSDRGMAEAAYRNNMHPDNLARHKATPMFDRSSFTRLRLLASTGSWDGRDPVKAATA